MSTDRRALAERLKKHADALYAGGAKGPVEMGYSAYCGIRTVDLLRDAAAALDAELAPARPPRCGCSDTPMEAVWECPACGNQTEEFTPERALTGHPAKETAA